MLMPMLGPTDREAFRVRSSLEPGAGPREDDVAELDPREDLKNSQHLHLALVKQERAAVGIRGASNAHQSASELVREHVLSQDPSTDAATISAPAPAVEANVTNAGVAAREVADPAVYEDISVPAGNAHLAATTGGTARPSSPVGGRGDEAQSSTVAPGTTDAQACTASGRSLTSAVVREACSFTITARDKTGKLQAKGGDSFVVGIRRGGIKLRSKVVDNADGTYTVHFKCELSVRPRRARNCIRGCVRDACCVASSNVTLVRSCVCAQGMYTIRVFLLGEELACSPAFCNARTPVACASQCTLSGDALLVAVARVQQSFDISFRDWEGRVTHAEELDVHVVPEGGTGTNVGGRAGDVSQDVHVGQGADQADGQQEVGLSAQEACIDGMFRSEAAAQLQSASTASSVASYSLKVASEVAQEAIEDGAIAPSSDTAVVASMAGSRSGLHVKRGSTSPSAKRSPVPLLRTEACVVTSTSPLIVRTGVRTLC